MMGAAYEKMVTEIPGHRTKGASEKGTFYFNGIPGVLARGGDGGTYAYRACDRTKLSATNLAGWDVCGGSYGTDSVTESAYIRFESGTVYRLFGGGQGTTKNATIELSGGVVAWASYGGALEGGQVIKTKVIYGSGDSKRKAYIGGEEGSILGEKGKAFSKGEYCAEVFLYDCAIQYITLGGKLGEVYGNIKYEQFGGSVLELETGGYKAKHYGNVDITVYGGMWEKVFRQQQWHEGNANLKLYEGIQRQEFIAYPVFEKQSTSQYALNVEYFSHPDNFRFVEYEDKRDAITDTSHDAGKLVVRFLETRVDDGFEKGTVKIRYGTGDSIYISFPNGQNMLIDTGMQQGGKLIVQDLKELGVHILDYLMITHDHHDHIGAIEAISDTFEVKNLLYQKFNTNPALQTVQAAQDANVRILGAGDVLRIGQGKDEVRFDVIGPDDKLVEEVKAKGCYEINHSSIAMVMSYGNSKVFLGADSLYENEKAWLSDGNITKLISNCQLMKLNHHGIFNANTPEFLSVVNAEKYVITQMREYGTQLGQAVAQLQGAFGITKDKIFATGKHGMIKAVVEKNGTIDMRCQYVEKEKAYENL